MATASETETGADARPLLARISLAIVLCAGAFAAATSAVRLLAGRNEKAELALFVFAFAGLLPAAVAALNRRPGRPSSGLDANALTMLAALSGAALAGALVLTRVVDALGAIGEARGRRSAGSP